MTSTNDPTSAGPLTALELGGDDPAAPAPQQLRDVAAEAAEDAAETGRKLRGGTIDVVLEDDTEHVVRIDNRDYVRFDLTRTRQKWPSGSDAPFLFQTFLAWSAMKRAGLTRLPWEQFQDACVFASMRKETEDDVTRPTE
jgi:hypothetical protein